MRIHTVTVEQSLASLKTAATGLSASEAGRRLAEYGPNHFEVVQ
ncbi:cation-transporting P-type ATPase, partial [Accumulibacter sp.]